jgi:hypothetical protein
MDQQGKPSITSDKSDISHCHVLGNVRFKTEAGHVKLSGNTELSMFFRMIIQAEELKAKMNDMKAALQMMICISGFCEKRLSTAVRGRVPEDRAEKKKNLALELNNRDTQYKCWSASRNQQVHRSELDGARQGIDAMSASKGKHPRGRLRTLLSKTTTPPIFVSPLLAIVVGPWVVSGSLSSGIFDNTVKSEMRFLIASGPPHRGLPAAKPMK